MYNFFFCSKLLGRIKTITNQTLYLTVQPGTPYVEVNNELKEKIKLVMAKRYNAETNALDLSNFCADSAFKEANLFVPMDRANVMTCVSLICNIFVVVIPTISE